jgi:hypothetical protein
VIGRSFGDDGEEMSELERRYHRLLRAYPAEYRAERGAEIVGTYLDLAGPQRRWPSPVDAVDLLSGGLRQRLRAAGSLGLLAGLPVAATLALTTAAVLAVVWLGAVETAPVSDKIRYPPFGPFFSPAAVVWLGWLAATAAAAIRPGWWARAWVAGALALTIAIVPICAITGYFRPPLYILVPQAALGLVALALPDHRRPWAALVPVIGAATTTAVLAISWAVPPTPITGYGWYARQLLTATAAALMVGALLTCIGYAIRRDSRGAWAALVLLTPASLLGVYPLAQAFGDAAGTISSVWSMLAGLAVFVTAVSMATLPLAVALQRGRNRRPPDQCPTCGHQDHG